MRNKNRNKSLKPNEKTPDEEEHRVFGQIRLNKTKSLRVTSRVWEGRTYVHVRVWVWTENGLAPTTTGCTFLPSEISAVRKALKTAQKELVP